MCSNAGERDVARRMGFGRPTPRLELPQEPVSSRAAGSLLQTLGVPQGATAAFVGVSDLRSWSPGWQRTLTGPSALPLRPVDVIVFQAESSFALRRIRDLATQIRDGGALWVLWPHGQAHVTENHVLRTGRAAGMVDVQTLAVSDRLSGLKFVRARKGR